MTGWEVGKLQIDWATIIGIVAIVFVSWAVFYIIIDSAAERVKNRLTKEIQDAKREIQDAKMELSEQLSDNLNKTTDMKIEMKAQIEAEFREIRIRDTISQESKRY